MMKNQTISIWPTRIKLDHALSRLVNVKNRRCKNVKNNFSRRPNARNNLRINRPPNALFFRRCNPFFLLFLFFFFAARYDLETTICMQPRASAAINSVILSWRRGRYRVSARKDRAYASIKRNCYSLPSAPPPAKGIGSDGDGQERVCRRDWWTSNYITGSPRAKPDVQSGIHSIERSPEIRKTRLNVSS